MFYSISKRTCNHFNTCVGGDSEVNKQLFAALQKGQGLIKMNECAGLKRNIEAISTLLKASLMQSLLYFSDERTRLQSDNDAAAHVATQAILPILDDIDPTSALTIATEMDFQAGLNGKVKNMTKVHMAVTEWFANPKAKGVMNCNVVAGTIRPSICRGTKNNRGDPNAP